MTRRLTGRATKGRVGHPAPYGDRRRVVCNEHLAVGAVDDAHGEHLAVVRHGLLVGGEAFIAVVEAKGLLRQLRNTCSEREGGGGGRDARPPRRQAAQGAAGRGRRRSR